MADSVEALFAARVASDPTRPIVTFYDDATGERTELSLIKATDVSRLEKAGVRLTSHKSRSASGGNLTGQTFLFTGTLEKLKRSEAEAQVEQQGGTIVNGVSSKLNYLVVGEDAGSKLEKAKKITSIRVLTEEEFLQLIKQ